MVIGGGVGMSAMSATWPIIGISKHAKKGIAPFENGNWQLAMGVLIPTNMPSTVALATGMGERKPFPAAGIPTMESPSIPKSAFHQFGGAGRILSGGMQMPKGGLSGSRLQAFG